jgi:hypothetical protein
LRPFCERFRVAGLRIDLEDGFDAPCSIVPNVGTADQYVVGVVLLDAW